MNRETHALFDPNRRETRGEGGVDATSHDSLSDCGCSLNYRLRFSSLPPSRMRSTCPAASSVDAWRRPGVAERLPGYRARCCVDGVVPEVPLSADDVRLRDLHNEIRNGGGAWGYGEAAGLSWLGHPPPPLDACDMSSSWAWGCVERACRVDFLANVTRSVENNASELARCERCDEERYAYPTQGGLGGCSHPRPARSRLAARRPTRPAALSRALSRVAHR